MHETIRAALLSGTPNVVAGNVHFEAGDICLRAVTYPDRDGLRLKSVESPMTTYAADDFLSPDEREAVQQKIAVAILADGEIDQWMCFLLEVP